MLVNVGTVLSVSAMTYAASASFLAAGFSGVGVLANWIKVARNLFDTALMGGFLLLDYKVVGEKRPAQSKCSCICQSLRESL